MLQRTYPGQLPAVRRDVHNLVLPVDLTRAEDIHLVVNQIQGFVKRQLPVRFGLVPIAQTAEATKQAEIVYHLLNTYGLSGVLSYLEETLKSNKVGIPGKLAFERSIKDRKLRRDKTPSSFEEIIASEQYSAQVKGAQKWASRLSVNNKRPTLFINGIAQPRNEDWLQLMSNRVTTDLHSIQNAIFQERIDTDMWVPDFWLEKASLRRNAVVIPEDETDLQHFDMNKLHTEHKEVIENLLRVQANTASQKSEWAYVVVVADLDTEYGQELLYNAALYRATDGAVELVVLHNAGSVGKDTTVSSAIHKLAQQAEGMVTDAASLIQALDEPGSVGGTADPMEATKYWLSAQDLVRSLGLGPGQHGVLINGRLVGPIPAGTPFIVEDFASAMDYERAKRIAPAYNAMEALGLSDKIVDSLSNAKISSIVALSSVSDVPKGIFEQASPLRISTFEIWESEHTAIKVGDPITAGIHITATVDPGSEIAQRWIPILKVISELDGVYLKLFLNPKERLQELPVKRFYRYVLNSKPTFLEDGSVRGLRATFKGVPQEALLTVALDVPAPWLVAPTESIYDLDNVKLSSAKSDVNAMYKLEHILIEGHSRELPGHGAPRGAQLVLGTERNPHFADTIIMANLGYFQFKATPGFYNIRLQEGRSAQIFNLDSVGARGWNPAAGDDTNQVSLMSFQGATLYPRLSRKPGQEREDVLEAKVDSPLDFVTKGLKFAGGMFGKATGEVKKQQHADINIFSVASGHLYERMLNIMMVSVMKHTKHTVKFWFIEQFLSPSFKDFIPYLAAEYGFEYEMVTYKWPHWLRAQKEKQREIWGYKILFLDVLFPLSLDKVIFVDADQIVRTDMIELVNHDLEGAPYGFTPMGDSRTEMEGFRFWKQGYWKNFLGGLPYHISALYVVDLYRFRQIAAGDRLRQQYHQLSADPNSLSNLDQDLPNHMQMQIPIHSLPEEWLWCETWCSDESLSKAKTIDLCNNPQTKEPKLDRARRQVPEWTVYDDEIAEVDKRRKGLEDKKEDVNTKSRTLEEVKTHVVDEL
jgi:UDP-glucose:glycoprotein glucosyltransferase